MSWNRRVKLNILEIHMILFAVQEYVNVVFLDLRAEGTQHLLSVLNSGKLESHHIPCATVTLSGAKKV